MVENPKEDQKDEKKNADDEAECKMENNDWVKVVVDSKIGKIWSTVRKENFEANDNNSNLQLDVGDRKSENVVKEEEHVDLNENKVVLKLNLKEEIGDYIGENYYADEKEHKSINQFEAKKEKLIKEDDECKDAIKEYSSFDEESKEVENKIWITNDTYNISKEKYDLLRKNEEFESKNISPSLKKREVKSFNKRNNEYAEDELPLTDKQKRILQTIESSKYIYLASKMKNSIRSINKLISKFKKNENWVIKFKETTAFKKLDKNSNKKDKVKKEI